MTTTTTTTTTTTAPAAIQPAELGFFATLATSGSLSAAARELGISTPAVSKRLAGMEARLGLALVNRTTRRMSLTPEGDLVLDHARRILADLDDLTRLLGASKGKPQGLLRVNATLGFGRMHVAPLVSRFVRQHPQVDVQLQLSVNPPPLTDDSFDVCVRFGAPADLVRHHCIGIRQGDEAYGLWRLTPRRGRGPAAPAEAVKTRGNLSSNDGEVAVHWALEGLGIVMRAEWDVERHLKSGRLVRVLPQYDTPDADIHAVWPQRLQSSTRVRSFVDFVAEAFARRAPAAG
jgi:LysR family transcriptional activator of dmlA